MYLITETYQSYETSSSNTGSRGRWVTRTRNTYYLQKGDDAPVVRYDAKVLEEYVKDYPPAMEYITTYKQQKKKIKTWSLINTSAVFGGAIIMGVTSPGDKINAGTYIGGTIMVGGLVNGIVNKIRKLKPYKNLQLAFDEYNSQVKRGKKK